MLVTVHAGKHHLMGTGKLLPHYVWCLLKNRMKHLTEPAPVLRGKRFFLQYGSVKSRWQRLPHNDTRYLFISSDPWKVKIKPDTLWCKTLAKVHHQNLFFGWQWSNYSYSTMWHWLEMSASWSKSNLNIIYIEILQRSTVTEEEKQHTLTSLHKSLLTPHQHYLHRQIHHRILIWASIWTEYTEIHVALIKGILCFNKCTLIHQLLVKSI